MYIPSAEIKKHKELHIRFNDCELKIITVHRQYKALSSSLQNDHIIVCIYDGKLWLQVIINVSVEHNTTQYCSFL